MRIIFIGASQFGLRSFKTVINIPGVEISGIISTGENFKISYSSSLVKNFLYSNFENYAYEKSIPYLKIDTSTSEEEVLNFIKKSSPDILLVVGWYHIIPKSWRDLAPAYGIHASLLPDYSGGAPLVWAMINDERKTGVTLFQMTHLVDRGPILDQREVPIYKDDDIKSLYSRVENAGLLY